MKDIIDAEFEMVGREHAEAKPSAQDETPQPFGKQDNEAKRPDKAQLRMFEPEPEPASTGKRLSRLQFAFVGLIACAGSFMVSGGYVLIGDWLMPQTPHQVQAVAYNGPLASVRSEGLLLLDVNFEQKANNGREYLSVDGVVRNEGQSPKIVPALRLMFGPQGNKARYRLERGENLAPGEQLVFTSSVPLRDTVPSDPVLEFIQ